MFTFGATPGSRTRPAVRRRPLWAAVSATVLLAGAACGNAGPAPGEPSATLDTSQPFGSDRATEGTPAAGGTLRVGMYSEARSFDPIVGSNLMASAVYDSLLKMDSSGEPQPHLAASMTTLDDGTTWHMGLRPGVTFHDGTPLDGEAVIFNVARQRDDPTALGHLYTEPITSMRAVDPVTVEFTLKRPTDPHYSAEAAQAYPSYDPERARQLIAEYRASGGDPDFTFQDANSPNNVQYATFLQAQWAAVGLDVQLQLDDIATVITQVVQGGNFQMLHWISGPYENPYPFMYNQFRTGGINNYGSYSNPQVDEALDEAASTTDPAQRVAAYQRAQLLLNQDLAVVWLARAAKAAIARPNVKGVSRYLSSELFWGDTWLAP